MNIQRN